MWIDLLLAVAAFDVLAAASAWALVIVDLMHRMPGG
jgi:hypothetical protein